MPAPLPNLPGLLLRTLVAVLALSACVARDTADRALLESYLRTEFRPDAPGGVVLVARRDRVLVRAAYGLADVEQGRALEPTDALLIASVTKSFAAAAILRLVEAGKLRLDDDVRAHVPEAPTGGRRVTLEQLLTHTSGMPNLVDRPGFEEWARRERTIDELVARTTGMDWRSEPGESFHYSDSGYILLGAVIERVSGLTFDRYVARELARPLGMRHTGSGLGCTARGYSDGALAAPLHLSVPHAAGQLASTVDDLLLWVQAWKHDRIASRSLSERAWSKRALPDGSVSSYGFGWKRDELAGRVLIGHGGWIPGFTAGVAHLPEDGLTAIVLANTDSGDPEASYVARRSLRLLLTGSPYVATVAVDAQRRAQLVGRYRTDGGTRLTIADPGDGGLSASFGEDDPLELVPLSASVFAVRESDGTWRFTFETDLDGRAIAVRTSLSGEPRELAHREQLDPTSR